MKIPCLFTQKWIPDREMNPALHCLVEVIDAVSGEEHDTTIIFKLAQEEHHDVRVP